jgi:hypothetical protein
MNKTRLLMFCVLLVSSTAFANPIRTVQLFSAERAGGHVRLTYVTNYYSGPVVSAFHGTSHSDWFQTGDSRSEDTGSGSQSMPYQYLCDCHVPAGDLEYWLGFSNTADLRATVTSNGGTAFNACDAPCALADSRDAGGDAAGSPTGGTSGTRDEGGGCAIASRGGRGALSSLVWLGLAALVLCRRR